MRCFLRFLIGLSTLFLSTGEPLLAEVDRAFRLGVINERPDKPDHALSQYGPLHAYLTERLAARGIRVDELIIARGIDEMAHRVADGEVDAVIEGVMPTLAIQRRTGSLVPSLLVWRKGQRQYHSVFFVRDDSPITGLHDLPGKTIVFEAPRSTSAYYVPRAALQAQGLTLASVDNREAGPQAIRYLFAGSELNQAYWVHRGRGDVGAFNNGDWDRVPDKIRQELRIIHATRPLLRWLLSYTTELDAGTRHQVTAVLESAHRDEAGRESLKAAARIAKFERLGEADREGLAYWTTTLSDLK